MQLVILSPVGRSLTWAIHRQHCPGMGRHARRAVPIDDAEGNVRDLQERGFKCIIHGCTKEEDR